MVSRFAGLLLLLPAKMGLQLIITQWAGAAAVDQAGFGHRRDDARGCGLCGPERSWRVNLPDAYWTAKGIGYLRDPVAAAGIQFAL
jgi:hypothetical protein